jgi:hypothetical protein
LKLSRWTSTTLARRPRRVESSREVDLGSLFIACDLRRVVYCVSILRLRSSSRISSWARIVSNLGLKSIRLMGAVMRRINWISSLVLWGSELVECN